MYSLLLAVIFLASVSFGLPDSLLGSGWPAMYEELGASVSWAGVVSMIIAGGTIISSLLSDWLTRKIGEGRIAAFSVLLTAIALFGFSLSKSFYVLCAWAVPYGLGAGAVDAAMNNYVATHYRSRHMSWLHCFWGVGAAISPYIMGYCLSGGLGWNMGYRFVGIIQAALTAVLFITLPLWKKNASITMSKSPGYTPAVLSIKQAAAIPGVRYILIAFFAYCAVETTTGLWASTYLVQYCGIGKETAARFASLFYIGITLGRFLSGFLAEKAGDKLMIRIGIGLVALGAICIVLPLGNTVSLVSLIVIGLGCAPIYPAVIHSTPGNFGRENSRAIIGIQMASAYVGSTFMPPLFGLLSSKLGIGLYPFFLLFLTVLMLLMSEILNNRLPVIKARTAPLSENPGTTSEN
jgi:fucose permease